jgi:hypothetical protein
MIGTEPAREVWCGKTLEILDMLHDPPPSRLQDLRTVLLKEYEGRLGDGLV